MRIFKFLLTYEYIVKLGTKNIFYIFTGIGFLLLVGFFFSWKNTTEFINKGVVSSGKVINMIQRESTDSETNRTSYTYAPEIEFTAKNEQKISFISSSSSNPPAYTIGEQVEIIYLEKSPNNAKIKGFWELWGFSLILFILGFMFFLIGIIQIWYEKYKEQNKQKLKESGQRIETNFQSIILNTNLTVNGINPYKIISQVEKYNNIYTFKSENIWFNPEKYVEKDKKITVFVDYNNMKKYRMDISFLPKIG